MGVSTHGHAMTLLVCSQGGSDDGDGVRGVGLFVEATAFDGLGVSDANDFFPGIG